MDETKKQRPVGEHPEDTQPVKLQFSIPQLAGSALAAATAAFLGSRLGTAGTILGAALASIIGAVAGTIYTAGLDRTTRRLSTVMKRGWQRVQGEDPSVHLEPGEGLDLMVEHHDPGMMAPVPTGAVVDDEAVANTRRAVLKRVLVGAVAIFAFALVVITAIELVTGYSLSGGSGTTVTDAVRPRPSTEPEPSTGPSASTAPSQPESTPAAPSQTAAPSPTPTPTPTLPAEPVPVPEPTPSETSAAPSPTPQVGSGSEPDPEVTAATEG